MWSKFLPVQMHPDFCSISRRSYCNSFIYMASREQHCYLFDNVETFGWRTLSHCLLPATESVVVLVGGVRCLKEEFWKKRRATGGWITGGKRIKQQWLTDGQEGGKLNIVIHGRSDGSQKIKIEMPDLICVTFTVTLHCVSLSECHICQYGSYHHHHLPHISAHRSASYFSR